MMQRRTIVLLLVFAGLGAACQSLPPPADTLPVTMFPWDLATGDAQIIRLMVRSSNEAHTIPAARQSALLTGARLAHLPSGDGVPMDSVATSPSTFFMQVDFGPVAPLEPGWYELSLQYRDEDGFQPSAPVTRDESGTSVARSRFLSLRTGR